MITLTAEAARQIKASASAGNTQNMALRIAVRRESDGSLKYAVGFDDTKGNPGDKHFESEGVSMVVANTSADLLDGTRIDYVKLDSGEMGFVFLNPNDPAYKPAG